MHSKDQKTRRQQWLNLVEEQKKSGLSQREFCKQKNIILSQFTYYHSLTNKNSLSQKSSDSLVPVKITNESATTVSSEIKLVLPNGFQCTFSSNLDATQLKRLIQVVLAC